MTNLMNHFLFEVLFEKLPVIRAEAIDGKYCGNAQDCLAEHKIEVLAIEVVFDKSQSIAQLFLLFYIFDQDSGVVLMARFIVCVLWERNGIRAHSL